MSELWQLVVTAAAEEAEMVSDRLAESALAVDIDVEGKNARLIGLFSLRLDDVDTVALIGDLHHIWRPLEQRDWMALTGRAQGAGRVGTFTLVDAPITATRLVSDKSLYVESFHAFGDGYHATTQGCLRALEYVRHHVKAQRMADIGTGTGVLALAARKLFPRARLAASDIDAAAVAITKRNRIHNGALQLSVMPGAGVAPVKRGRPYDVMTANILAGPLARMARGIKSCLKPGGFVVLSGLLESQMPLIVNAYRLQRLHVRWRYIHNGWVTLVLR